MIVIGLGHKARQGKDCTAKAMSLYAARQYGIAARQYGFADALKAHCRVAYGMRQKNASLLQIVGTDLYRRQDPGIWARILVDTLNEQRPHVAIVTDVRFENECDVLKRLGGSLVKITRLNVDGTQWVAPDRDPQHQSETALDYYGGWDEYIECNDGRLEALEHYARTTFDRIYKEACGG